MNNIEMYIYIQESKSGKYYHNIDWRDIGGPATAGAKLLQAFTNIGVISTAFMGMITASLAGEKHAKWKSAAKGTAITGIASGLSAIVTNKKLVSDAKKILSMSPNDRVKKYSPKEVMGAHSIIVSGELSKKLKTFKTPIEQMKHTHKIMDDLLKVSNKYASIADPKNKRGYQNISGVIKKRLDAIRHDMNSAGSKKKPSSKLEVPMGGVPSESKAPEPRIVVDKNSSSNEIHEQIYELWGYGLDNHLQRLIYDVYKSSRNKPDYKDWTYDDFYQEIFVGGPDGDKIYKDFKTIYHKHWAISDKKLDSVIPKIKKLWQYYINSNDSEVESDVSSAYKKHLKVPDKKIRDLAMGKKALMSGQSPRYLDELDQDQYLIYLLYDFS